MASRIVLIVAVVMAILACAFAFAGSQTTKVASTEIQSSVNGVDGWNDVSGAGSIDGIIFWHADDQDNEWVGPVTGMWTGSAAWYRVSRDIVPGSDLTTFENEIGNGNTYRMSWDSNGNYLSLDAL